MQVAETAEVYFHKVLPYIQSLPASRIAWVYNILEKKVSPNLATLDALSCLIAGSIARIKSFSSVLT